MTRAEQQQLTRERLLDATLGVVRSRGLHDATIEEITEIAGYTRGAFYAHFGSKEEAVLEVLELHADDQVAAFRAAVMSAPTDEAAVAVLASLMGTSGSDRASGVEYAELAAKICRSDDLRARARELQSKIDLLLGECVESICERRGQQPRLPRAELGAIVGAILGGLASRNRLESDLQADRVFADALALVVGA
jgi:AcrR family transcriptional regulator